MIRLLCQCHIATSEHCATISNNQPIHHCQQSQQATDHIPNLLKNSYWLDKEPLNAASVKSYIFQTDTREACCMYRFIVVPKVVLWSEDVKC